MKKRRLDWEKMQVWDKRSYPFIGLRMLTNGDTWALFFAVGKRNMKVPFKPVFRFSEDENAFGDVARFLTDEDRQIIRDLQALK